MKIKPIKFWKARFNIYIYIYIYIASSGKKTHLNFDGPWQWGQNVVFLKFKFVFAKN